MKKAIMIFAASAAAAMMSTFSAYAGDVEFAPKPAVVTDNGAVYTVDTADLSAARFTEDTVVKVVCEGVDGDKSPVKLVVDYWDRNNESEFDFGSPASVTVAASGFKDGTAEFTYADITAALGDNKLSSVFAIDIASDNKDISCTSFSATNVISFSEMAEQDIRTTIRVHAKKPHESDNWGQSISVGVDQFDISSMADNSWVVAVFESELDKDVVSAPVEFILQSTDDTVSPKAKNGTVWGKVPPVLFNNKYALFDFSSMTDAYGTDDFSCVTTVYVGDTGTSPITCTDIYALDVRTLETDEPEAPAESETTEESDAAEESVKPVETTKAPAADVSEVDSYVKEEEEAKSNLALIIIGIVAGIVVAAGTIFVILGRKSRETYDVNKHRYVKK
jgi:hypothetical protein